MEKVTQNIVNIGVNDREITLFEGQYALEKGMAYNSYAILDEARVILTCRSHNYIEGINEKRKRGVA